MDALINFSESTDHITLFMNDNECKIKIVGTHENPYFCGKDVCEILGYLDIKKALQNNVKSKHKEDLKTINEKIKLGCENSPNFLGSSHLENISYHEGKAVYINEPGLYSLIMHSKAKFAEAFQDLVYETILPSIRKYGSYTLEKKFEEKLNLKDKVLEEKDKELVRIKNNAKEAEKARKIAETRQEMVERLSIAHRERMKTQIFYIVTSKAMACENEFKIGGVENRGLLKKRLCMYNTGCSGDRTFFYVTLLEIHNYKQMESRVKELIGPFRAKRNMNTENFRLHFKILKPLIEMIAEHYNDEIDKLNEFVKAFLDIHTDEYLEPVDVSPLDPDDMPSEYNITITKRRFGTINCYLYLQEKIPKPSGCCLEIGALLCCHNSALRFLINLSCNSVLNSKALSVKALLANFLCSS